MPPLRIAEKDTFDRRKNPFFHHAEVQHFLARRGARVVGRIAAIENRLHNETHGDRLGFFGFFDVEPDPEAATGAGARRRAPGSPTAVSTACAVRSTTPRTTRAAC